MNKSDRKRVIDKLNMLGVKYIEDDSYIAIINDLNITVKVYDDFEVSYIRIIDIANTTTIKIESKARLKRVKIDLPTKFAELIIDLPNAEIHDMEDWFSQCNVSKITIKRLNVSHVDSIAAMFSECESLVEVDLSGLDTHGIKTIRQLFKYCENLKKINVSNWDTSSVRDMSEVFYNCSSLKKLDISDWDTSSVQYFTNMFKDCQNLEELDVSNFDMSSAINTQQMFCRCRKIKRLDVSKWNIGMLVNMQRMFFGCSQLEEVVGLENLVPIDTYDMHEIFTDCEKIKQIKLPNIHSKELWKMNITSAFNNCTGVEEIDIRNIALPAWHKLDGTFSSCQNLRILHIYGINMNETDGFGAGPFTACKSLEEIRLYGDITDLYKLIEKLKQVIEDFGVGWNSRTKTLKVYVGDKLVEIIPTDMHIKSEKQLFCALQGIDSDGVYCCAHINSGRVFNCLYKSVEEAKAKCIDYKQYLSINQGEK